MKSDYTHIHNNHSSSSRPPSSSSTKPTQPSQPLPSCSSYSSFSPPPSPSYTSTAIKANKYIKSKCSKLNDRKSKHHSNLPNQPSSLDQSIRPKSSLTFDLFTKRKSTESIANCDRLAERRARSAHPNHRADPDQLNVVESIHSKRRPFRFWLNRLARHFRSDWTLNNRTQSNAQTPLLGW